MRYAVGKGCFIVVAAGNEFEDGDPRSARTRPASSPRSRRAVAGRHFGGGRRSRRRTTRYYSSTGSYIEICGAGRVASAASGATASSCSRPSTSSSPTRSTAPAVAVLRAPRFDVFGYIGFTGTSMAAPHVAGVAAMLMQQGITDPAAIEDALEKIRRRPRHAGPRQHIRVRAGGCARGAARIGAGEVKTTYCILLCPGHRAGAPPARGAGSSGAVDPSVCHGAPTVVRRRRHLRRRLREVRGRRSSAAACRSSFSIVSSSRSALRASGRPASARSTAAATTFSLGIPLTATITPLEVTGGYRFPLREHAAVRPMWRRASARTRYKETSDFSDPGENVDTRRSGFVVERRRRIPAAPLGWRRVDVQYSRVKGILGRRRPVPAGRRRRPGRRRRRASR